jgi:hypothetical protein
VIREMLACSEVEKLAHAASVAHAPMLRGREGRRWSEARSDEQPEAITIFAPSKAVALLRAFTSTCCEVHVAALAPQTADPIPVHRAATCT